MSKQAGSLQEWSIVRLPDGRVGTLHFRAQQKGRASVRVSESLSIEIAMADEVELIVSAAVGMQDYLRLKYLHLVLESQVRTGALARGLSLRPDFHVRYAENDEVYILGDYGYCLWPYDRGWSLGFWSETSLDEDLGNPLRHDVPLEAAIETFLDELAEKQARPPAPDAHLESDFEDRVCGGDWDL
jgi:hypothetical protein